MHVMTFGAPIPLLRMLKALPFVAEVTPEPRTEALYSIVRLRSARRSDRSPCRWRLTFKS